MNQQELENEVKFKEGDEGVELVSRCCLAPMSEDDGFCPECGESCYAEWIKVD